MSRFPSLAALRAKVQKERHREIGNWLARRVARPTAIYGTWLAVRLGMSAHAVTGLAMLAFAAAAVALGTGTRAGFIAGVGLWHLGFWLDHVDGQVARWREMSSLDGVYLDYLMHHAATFLLGSALGYGLAERSGDPRWALAGVALAFGWTGLALHNDCRYKAFFQRLKRAEGAFLVVGGGGGRPAPPAPWPRHGLGALTWPAYKACEPHVILLGLTALAALAALAPGAWLILWRDGVRLMAVVAPILAIARATRAVARGAAEREFALWFRPTPGQDGAARYDGGRADGRGDEIIHR